MNRFATFASAGLFVAVSGIADAQQLYYTGFEPPLYPTSGSINNRDGWTTGTAFGISNGISQTVAIGTQSLRFDNSASLNTRYSVKREMPPGIEDGFEVTAQVYIDGTTGENRLYGVYLVDSPAGVLVNTTLGLTIDGGGRVRAGTDFDATWDIFGIIDTAAPGTFKDRWLTFTLTWTPTGGGEVEVSGFAAPQEPISASFTLANAPQGLNLGTDRNEQVDRNGIGYFDELFIEAVDAGCPADLNGDGVVDADDFFLFLQLFADGDPRADINQDGVVDADDFFQYLNLFAQGC